MKRLQIFRMTAAKPFEVNGYNADTLQNDLQIILVVRTKRRQICPFTQLCGYGATKIKYIGKSFIMVPQRTKVFIMIV